MSIRVFLKKRFLHFSPAAIILIIFCFTPKVSGGVLEELESSLISLADKVRPAVVSLSPYVPPSSSVGNLDAFKKGRPTSAGAGVLIDAANGYLVTNSHVVRNADRITVRLLDGQELVGQVVGADEDTDLAVVQIESDRPLSSAVLGDSSKLKVGQLVVAVGNPYGLNNTLTLGIISGLNRENINLSRYEDFIQTDASINPGNSGGPLLNIRGEVVGINTAIINYAQSIGFAIPSNMVERVIGELIKYGEVQRGWLGVGIEPVSPELAVEAHLEPGLGVMVNAVFEGDPAFRAGLKPGDIILKIAGTPVNSPSGVIRIIGVISPGQTVNLDIVRDGKAQVVQVKLEKQRKRERVAALPPSPLADVPPLGIHVEDTSADGGGEGLLVAKVFQGSSAMEKGLVPGDRIISINGNKINNREQYQQALDKISTGQEVYLLVVRNNQNIHLALVRQN